MLYARVYFIWLTLNSFTDKLDREGGAPIDISIEKLDKNGFQATRNGGNSKFMAPCTYYSAVSPPTSVSSSGNSKVKHSFNSLFFCDFQICYFVSICLCICFFTSNPVGLFRSHHLQNNLKCIQTFVRDPATAAVHHVWPIPEKPDCKNFECSWSLLPVFKWNIAMHWAITCPLAALLEELGEVHHWIFLPS